MRMQVAEVGTYKIILYKRNDGLWDFWIKQKGHRLVKSTGTEDCEETKLLVQKHLYDVVMTKKEKSTSTQAVHWNGETICGGPMAMLNLLANYSPEVLPRRLRAFLSLI